MGSKSSDQHQENGSQAAEMQTYSSGFLSDNKNEDEEIPAQVSIRTIDSNMQRELEEK